MKEELKSSEFWEEMRAELKAKLWNEKQVKQNLFSTRQDDVSSSAQMRSNISLTTSMEETYCCLYLLIFVLTREKVICATAIVYPIGDGKRKQDPQRTQQAGQSMKETTKHQKMLQKIAKVKERGSVGCESVKKFEHLLHSVVDLFSLLEDSVFKPLHSFDVCYHVVSYSSLEIGAGCGPFSRKLIWSSSLRSHRSALMVVEGKNFNDFPRFFGVLVMEFATASAVNLTLKMKGDMVIKI
nr:hypothetical protein [Tanacetum cinerariifolium]